MDVNRIADSNNSGLKKNENWTEAMAELQA